ncbi:hypothetical protein ACHAWF_004961 [Thalassiosira exigua]
MVSSEENDVLLPSTACGNTGYNGVDNGEGGASAAALEDGHDEMTSQMVSIRRLVRDRHSFVFSAGSSRYSYCTPFILGAIGIGVALLCFVFLLVQEEYSGHPWVHTAGLPRLGFHLTEFPSALLGKSKHVAKSGKEDKKKEKHNSCHDSAYECEADTRYSKNTLKRAYDLPYAALFRDTRGQSKFEASDVTIVNDTVYSVCDSSWAISKFTRDLIPFSEKNVQIGDPTGGPNREEGDESGYEAIFEHAGLFYVVRESIFHADHDHEADKESSDDTDDDDDDVVKKDESSGDYHAIVEELLVGEDDYTLVRECQCEFTFEGDSKGFEGAVGFPDDNGDLYILGLCEGNHCSEERKEDVGNGRVVLMKKREDSDGNCLWETVRVVHVPESAAFLDYSAIDITNAGRVAIASQEYSSVWLGHAFGISNGIIDPDAFDFVDDSNSVLQFPKDGTCHTIYCNIEGIHFINDEMLMAVSDKMKSKGRQDFRCHEKDQSIHAFVIP